MGNLRNINFILDDTGISATLNLLDNDKRDSYSGILKGSILKSSYKLDFLYNNKLININRFFFRDKKLSFDSTGNVELSPFFKISLKSEIKKFDKKILNNIKISKVFD